MTEDWLTTGKKAAASKQGFEDNYSELPGKIRKLMKHLDPRSGSKRNTDREIEKMSEEARQCLQSMVRYHQAFPLNHKYKQERHQNKYGQKTKSRNHLISKDEIKSFDKRQG